MCVCVCVCVCVFRLVPPTSKKLKGHIAPGTFVRSSVRPSGRLFVTLFDAKHFRTVHATVLKFLIWSPHEKIADMCFVSQQDYALFLSNGPLKKYGCSLVSKISKKKY